MSDNYNDDYVSAGEEFDPNAEPDFDTLAGDDVYEDDETADLPPVEDTVVVTSWSPLHDAPIEEEVSRADYEASHPTAIAESIHHEIGLAEGAAVAVGSTDAVNVEPQIEVIGPRSRVFVVGGTRIPEGEHTTSMTAEQVRESLKATFPEVANATIREREESGVSYVEFLPQPGRKG